MGEPSFKPKLEEDFWSAIQARDAVWDGRFYYGVRTTRIYCRPSCPARPKRSNVRYFESRSSAEAAGYRACRRCRPELRPGSRQWSGTAAVVARACRLLETGQCEGGIPRVASRLGVTERHLRRLFARHLGVPPVAFVTRLRLANARRILRESQVPVTEVAWAAGFGSVRRFNDAFQAAFGCSPSAFRAGRSAGKQS